MSHPSPASPAENMGQPAFPTWADWRQLKPPTWLEDALQPERLRDSLIRYIPEFVTGSLRLQHFATKRLRLSDDEPGWRGTFLLAVEGLQPGRQQVVPLQGFIRVDDIGLSPGIGGEAFDVVNWHCYLPDLHLELRTLPLDKELAALPQLVDAQSAQVWLEQSLRSASSTYHDLTIQQCSATVMRYKPGNRATVRYQLGYGAAADGHNWPALVIAKTYKGARQNQPWMSQLF